MGGTGRARERRALARIEKLVAARAKVERALDDKIGQAVARARSAGASRRGVRRALRRQP